MDQISVNDPYATQMLTGGTSTYFLEYLNGYTNASSNLGNGHTWLNLWSSGYSNSVNYFANDSGDAGLTGPDFALYPSSLDSGNVLQREAFAIAPNDVAAANYDGTTPSTNSAAAVNFTGGFGPYLGSNYWGSAVNSYLRRFAFAPSRLSNSALSNWVDGSTPITANVPDTTTLASGSAASSLPLVGVSTHQNRNNNTSTPTPDSTNVALAQAAGATVMRTDANWQSIEGTPGTYDFSGLDPTVNAFRTAGFTVDLMLGYGNTNYTGGYYDAPTTTATRTAFDNFVTAVANHYGSSGFIYEIWNEPNLDWDWLPSPNASAYATLLTSSSAAIQAAKPGATVIGAGTSPGPGITPATFVAGVASAGGFTSNVAGISYHPYNSTYPEQEITDAAAIAAAEGGAGKPIYNTEWGYEQDWVNYSQDTLAVYAARTLLSSIVSGVKSMDWYDLIDDFAGPTNASNFGLNDFNFNPLPAAGAYDTIASLMAEATSYNIISHPSANIYEIIFHKSSGSARVVWTYNTFDYGAFGMAYSYTDNIGSYSALTVKDVFGNNVPYTVSGDNITFDLSNAAGPVILTVTP